MIAPRLRRWRRFIFWGLGLLLLLLGGLWYAGEYYVGPLLRERLEVLIVRGSDSLYRYDVGKLDASLFGGSVEIDELNVRVDSNRYRQLEAARQLPPLTFEVKMHHGHLRKVNVFGLLFGKKVEVGELFTSDAQVELSRHTRDERAERASSASVPLWRAIRPSMNSIQLHELRLEGIRFKYAYADTAEAQQIKFDTCNVRVRDIKVDSATAADGTRIGYARVFTLHLSDLKFRSADSATKFKAKWIDYSSEGRRLTIDSFKLQPTRKDKESFYAHHGTQRDMTVIEFGRLAFEGFQLERFLNANSVVADSLVILGPKISIYNDKTLPPSLEGKMGRYPHQFLQRSAFGIKLKHLALRDLELSYTEKGEKTGREGTLLLEGIQLAASNISNFPDDIKRDSLLRVRASGRLLGSAIETKMDFHLNSGEGRFDMEGRIGAMSAAQLNTVSEPLGNARIRSLNLQELQFFLHGDEYTARGEVRMRYRNLAVELQKEDEATGLLKTRVFLNKLLNKYTLRHDNPDASGREMRATQVQQSRLMTQAFFGLVWKSIFSGMQTIMTNAGTEY
ncbi:hypothetical protein [Flaviaesturariibacter amylovorans]|uniref:DUF748 domain-containing protein n=1 Tax=Flaviaesturariibacter amylovorans TaxID=1084520 RepID=A0ABP8HG37_9BACT